MCNYTTFLTLRVATPRVAVMLKLNSLMQQNNLFW